MVNFSNKLESLLNNSVTKLKMEKKDLFLKLFKLKIFLKLDIVCLSLVPQDQVKLPSGKLLPNKNLTKEILLFIKSLIQNQSTQTSFSVSLINLMNGAGVCSLLLWTICLNVKKHTNLIKNGNGLSSMVL
jgi:hypothetical protein